jgi:hypothetical protein
MNTFCKMEREGIQPSSLCEAYVALIVKTDKETT